MQIKSYFLSLPKIVLVNISYDQKKHLLCPQLKIHVFFQVAGFSKPRSEICPSVAEEALEQLKDRITSMESELHDLKIKVNLVLVGFCPHHFANSYFSLVFVPTALTSNGYKSLTDRINPLAEPN